MWPFTSSTPTPSPVSADKCPVDHSTRAAWLQANQGASPFHPTATDEVPKPDAKPLTSPSPAQTFVQTAASTTQDSAAPSSTTTPSSKTRDESYLSSLLSRLSNQREVSSIPRYESTFTPTHSPNGEQTVTSSSRAALASTSAAAPETRPNATSTSDGDETHWVYPSEQQFFLAMMRKHSAKMYSPSMPPPQPEDMKTIVPIHNAVNERAWHELMKWEQGQGGDKCGGVRLVSFKGRPKDRTPKAWINVALGYTAPFDRHDWVINRCGEEIRYVIDFYSGRAPAAGANGGAQGLPPKDAGNLSFYLDVRPAVDSWEGIRLRASKLFGQ